MTRQEVIDLYFDGDRSLYNEYAEACLVQFTLDIETGDVACAQGDMTTMRHLSHGLRTLMQTLGRSDLSALARSIEEACIAAQAPVVHEAWHRLRAALPRAFDDCPP